MCYSLFFFANNFLFGGNLHIERKGCLGTAKKGGEEKRYYLIENYVEFQNLKLFLTRKNYGYVVSIV